MTDQHRLTILTICREPLLNILRFVAWHRDLGADRIILHFDDPDDPAIPHLEGLDFVGIVRCTPDFWRSIGKEPDEAFVRRQNAAITRAYRQVETGWVGVLDGDELFFDETGDLPARLAGLAPEVRALRVETAEAISTPALPGAHFRSRLPPPAIGGIYGDLAPLVRRNGGLVGHSEGKSLARAGLEIRLFRQHWPVSPEREPLTDLVLGPADGLRLLHFFGEDWQGWRRKLDWRLASWGFAPRVRAHLLEQAAAGDPETVWHQVWRGLHVFDAARTGRLAAAGGLFRPARDLLEPARHMFGAALVDGLAGAGAETGSGGPAGAHPRDAG